MRFVEKTIQRKIAFDGKLLKLEQLDVELHDGTPAYREIIRHPGAIGVVGRLPGDRFVFVRQYRKAVESVMTEVVAGLLDPGEAPETAARRELLEETGHRAKSLVHLGTIYASPGYVDEKVEIYLADLEEGTEAGHHPDHGEHVEKVLLTRREFVDALRKGEIRDAKTLAAWALFCEYETSKS